MFTKELFDINYALAEAATDKRLFCPIVEMKIRGNILCLKRNWRLVVDGMHTIKRPRQV